MSSMEKSDRLRCAVVEKEAFPSYTTRIFWWHSKALLPSINSMEWHVSVVTISLHCVCIKSSISTPMIQEAAIFSSAFSMIPLSTSKQWRVLIVRTPAFVGQHTRTYSCGLTIGSTTWLSLGSRIVTRSQTRSASLRSSWQHYQLWWDVLVSWQEHSELWRPTWGDSVWSQISSGG